MINDNVTPLAKLLQTELAPDHQRTMNDIDWRIDEVVNLRWNIESNLENQQMPAISAQALDTLDKELRNLRDLWCLASAKRRVADHIAKQTDPSADADWKALVDARRHVDAFKLMRKRHHGYSIRHATDILDAYRDRKHGYHRE